MPIIRANNPIVLKMISFLNTKKAMPLIIGISDEIKYKIVELSSKKELELLQCNKNVMVIENYLIHLIGLLSSS